MRRHESLVDRRVIARQVNAIRALLETETDPDMRSILTADLRHQQDRLDQPHRPRAEHGDQQFLTLSAAYAGTTPAPARTIRLPRRSRGQHARRPRSRATRSSARSGDSGDDGPEPEPPAAPLGSIFEALHAATRDLTGPERALVFLAYPPRVQLAAWLELTEQVQR